MPFMPGIIIYTPKPDPKAIPPRPPPASPGVGVKGDPGQPSGLSSSFFWVARASCPCSQGCTGQTPVPPNPSMDVGRTTRQAEPSPRPTSLAGPTQPAARSLPIRGREHLRLFSAAGRPCRHQISALADPAGVRSGWNQKHSSRTRGCEAGIGRPAKTRNSGFDKWASSLSKNDFPFPAVGPSNLPQVAPLHGRAAWRLRRSAQ